MTRTPTAAIDIAPRCRQGSGSPEGTVGTDMLLIGGSPLNQFPGSYVNVPSDLPTHHEDGDREFAHLSPSSDHNSSFVTQLNNSSFFAPLMPSATTQTRANGVSFADVPLLPGEAHTAVVNPEHDGVSAVDGGSLLLTNFRLIYLTEAPVHSISVFPLFALEQTDFRDPCQVVLTMKEGRVQRLNFLTYEDAVAWHRTLTKIMSRLNKTFTPDTSDADVFTWKFGEALDNMKRLPSWLRPANSLSPESDIVAREFDRLGLGATGAFRITTANADFGICECYPEATIVPSALTDEELKKAASYRALCRFPAVVWRSRHSKSVLMRSSQPRVGILSWRDAFDEKIFQAVNEYANAGFKEDEEWKQIVILDARTYTAAFANRARGGGFENSEYYQQAKVEFLGLPNIHTVRNSFVAMRQLLSSTTSNETLLQSLQATGWLHNLSSLLSSATACADFLLKGQSVLVHCSDGWDRTSQLVSLAKVMLDEHYRTIKGFEELIRREWLAFGHKFYDRQLCMGGWDPGERSPIFLQFLEAVRHLQREAPTAFQFTHAYLIKLAQHAFSGLFGTFLFNSLKEKKETCEMRGGRNHLVEIWRYLGEHNEEFVNQSYDERYSGRLKAMNFNVLNLRVWHEVFADEERYMSLYSSIPASVNGIAPLPASSSPTSSTQQHPLVSPVKDAVVVDRPTSGSGMTTSGSGTNPQILKSKSSESINSMNNVDGTSNVMTHSGSNGTIASIEAIPASTATPTPPSHPPLPLEVTTPAMATNSSSSQANMSIRSVKTVQETIDDDGLLKFHDEEQEIQRRKQAKLISKIRERDAEIHDLKSRRRSESERTNGSVGATSGYSHGGRMRSLCEVESDSESLERALSDMSVVDPSEVTVRSGHGWEVNRTECTLCGKIYSLLSVNAEDREHHCRNCGHSVCQSCSLNRIHMIEEGRGLMKRVCDPCYDNMNGTKPNTDGVLSRTVSLNEVTSLDEQKPNNVVLFGGTSSGALATPATIPSPCKSTTSTTTMTPPRPVTGNSPADGTSPSNFSRIGSSQAVKG